MDDPNITLEKYIRLEEEKARRHGKVYNWETATYDRIWYDDDVHDLRSVETEFPAIVFNDKLTSKEALSCETMVSSLDDNKINFRISFDESDAYNYTPTFQLFDDLDYFKDFEKVFPAIVYNDALMFKLDSVTEPSVSPQHIDEFNLNDETSLSKCDGEEQKFDFANMALPPRDQRHPYLRFEGLEYTDGDIADFKDRLGKIYGREMHQAESARQILDKRDLSAYWVGISYVGDFHGTSPSYTLIRDLMIRLCHRLIACNIAGRSQAPKKVIVTEMFYLRGMDFGLVNISYLLARYLRMFASGRKRGAMISGGQFVAPGLERQHDAAVGAPKVAESAPDIAEGAQAIPAPVQAPQPPPVAGPARSLS
ncbi:hypothetical protein Tco_0089569 [Tanacetum coccineum]